MDTNTKIETQEPNTIVEKKKRGRKPVLTEEEKQQRKKENVDKYREQRKIYYNTIYVHIRDKSIRTQCTCGEMVLEANAARHRRSKKCIDKCRQNNKLENEDN